MLPVDMRGVGQEFDDVGSMLEKLGSKGMVEAFMKARAFFDKNVDGAAKEDRAQPITAKEWCEVLNDGALGEGGDEEEDEGDEEESFDEEDEDDDDDDDA